MPQWDRKTKCHFDWNIFLIIISRPRANIESTQCYIKSSNALRFIFHRKFRKKFIPNWLFFDIFGCMIFLFLPPINRAIIDMVRIRKFITLFSKKWWAYARQAHTPSPFRFHSWPLHAIMKLLNKLNWWNAAAQCIQYSGKTKWRMKSRKKKS